MRIFGFFCVTAVTAFWLATAQPCWALSAPDLDPAARIYANALKDKYGTQTGDTRRLMQRAAETAQGEKWADAVRLLEELTGRALAGQQIAGETTAGLLHRLGEAWHGHSKTADEGLWAAYLAQTMPPRNRGPGNLASLVLLGEILLDQITDLHGNFDYRGQTLDKIASRLNEFQYSPARIAAEDAEGRLPADIRELIDLKAREERERMLIVDKITGRMALANTIYHEIASSAEHEELRGEIKKAINKRLFYVTNIYPDARRSTAAICLTFNLPLRPDAGEYRDMIKVFRVGPERLAATAVSASEQTVTDQTLCIHGLRHGYSYHILAQKGLPSRSGAVLAEDFDTRVDKRRKPGSDDDDVEARGPEIDPAVGVKIPNRKASAGFRSTAFILPESGGGSVPLMTVNVSRVDLDLLRLSDRTLHRQIALGHIGEEIDKQEFADLRHHFSDSYWRGGVDLPTQPNETITTDIPIRQLLDARDEVLGKLQGEPLNEPYLSGVITTGPLRGRFRVDRLSAGAPEFRKDYPGVYALIAKANQQTSSLDLSLEQTEAAVADVSGTTKGGDTYLSDSGYDTYFNSCKDEETRRNFACKLSVQWFVRTDIGLTYYRGPKTLKEPKNLYVIARSLHTGEPIDGARIELIAANNRVLADGTTDSNGVAQFNSQLSGGSEGNRLAAITATKATEKGFDFSFVTFSRDVFDLSDHGTAGRRPPRLLDAYVYSDRGVYRPEESIHTTVLVRDTDGDAVARVPPVIVKLRASNGKVVEEKRIVDPTNWHLGGTTVDLLVPPSAPLGQADILVFLGDEKEPIGTTTVQLDHFRPDRARITFVREQDWHVTTQDNTVTITGFADAQYLFGFRPEGSLKTDAPAANLAAEAAMLIQPAATPFDGCYAQFRFGRIENEPTPLLHRQALANRTNANGDLTIAATGKLPREDVPLQARFTLTLFDEAGKVGQHSRLIRIPIERPWLGVASQFQLLPTKDALFQLSLSMLALDARNELRSARLKYRIWRERNVFIWHQDSSSWRYLPDVQRSLIKEGSTDARGGSAGGTGCKSPNADEVRVELPLGRYYVEVEDEAGTRVSFRQDAGWSGAGAHAPTPDRLTIRSDAELEGELPTYRPNKIARFSIEAPFDGEVLLAIANDRVLNWERASTTGKIATIDMKIRPEWAGDAFYALATVYRRNTDGTVLNGPSRAIGASYFAVDRESERKLKLEIGSPGATSPAQPLVQVPADRPLAFDLISPGLQGRAWATVYAVDEGLISLTDHPAPAPFQHFFGRRALAIEVMDNYGRILLADRGGRDRSGGDRSRRLFLTNYTSDRILAEYKGPLEFVNGVAHVQFDKPFDFNGTIRLAAIAWTDRKVGATTSSVLHRQRVVANLKMPRFMTPGDRVTVPLTLHPLDALEGRYRVSVAAKEPLTLESVAVTDASGGKAVGPGIVELDLPNQQDRTLQVVLSLPSDGKSKSSEVEVHVDATEAGIRSVNRTFDVAIRPAEAPTTDMALVDLPPGAAMRLEPKQILDLARGRFLEKGLAVQFYASTDPFAAARRIGPDAQDPQVGMLERLIWRGMIELYAANADGRKEIPGLVREIEALEARDGYFVGYRLVSETGLQESRDIVDHINEPIGRFERLEIWRTALALDFLLQVRKGGLPVNDAGVQSAIRTLQGKLRDVLRNDNDADDLSGSSDTGTNPEQKPSAGPKLAEDKDDPVAARSRGAEQRPALPPASTKRARGGELVLKLLSGTNEKTDSGQEKRANEPGDTRDDTSAPSSRDVKACDEDMLYAAFILAEHDAIDRFDLSMLVRACGRQALSPIGAAMLAAALNKFGVVEEARGVLASIDARAGAAGDDPAGQDVHFDAMMLAFLVLADAKPELKAELTRRLATSGQHLSLPTRAWLARAYAEASMLGGGAAKPLSVSVEGRLGTEAKNDHELASEFVPIAELASRGAALRNNGSDPVTLAVLLHGIPQEAANQSDNGLKIERKVINREGVSVDLQRAKLRPNEVLYVILTGVRAQADDDADKSHLQDPVVIVDPLPAGFEIIDRDVFAFARNDAVALRAVLPSDGRVGRLRVAEARDDQLLAVVKPTPEGNFQIGYSVRAVAAGRFVHPGTIVEDLYRPSLATHNGAGTVEIEARGQP